jgi:hypothetical protein
MACNIYLDYNGALWTICDSNTLIFLCYAALYTIIVITIIINNLTIFIEALTWLYAIGPSKQVSRRTYKKDLIKRLNNVVDKGLESYNKQIL